MSHPWNKNFDIQQVIDLVRSARSIILNREMAGHVKEKGRADYVTQVDLAVQDYLKEELYSLAPDIQFLGEESGLQEMTGDRFWILDPVDGTTNLIHDYQHSAISLGLCCRDEIVMGIIYDPWHEELFSAEQGRGSFLNGAPIRVSQSETLSETIIALGTYAYRRELADANFARFRRVYDQCQDIRRIGSAALELAYTACGRQGGFFEPYLNPWDYAAGAFLVREAGGVVTDFEGNPPSPRKGGSIVSTNGKIHEELLGLL